MRITEYADSRVLSLTELHRALSDETRVRLVHLLQHKGELCVCDLEATLQISQSKTSRHLTHLKIAGIVADQRRGAWVYYRLRPQPAGPVRSALRELKRALAEDPQALADLKRAERSSCAPLEVVKR